MIDFSSFTGVARPDSPEVERHQKPEREVRPQAEREATPDAYQKSKEMEGSSTWSGGSGGGGTWAGRSR